MSGPRTAANTTGRSFRMIAVGLLAGMMAACGGQPQPLVTTPSPPPSIPDATNTAAAIPASDTGSQHDTITAAGHYLAARQALYFNDVGLSATFFLQTLEAESDSIPLLRQAFLTQYYYGDIERAAALGRQL
ncbi:MAG: hypothetical protein ACPG67_06595, partial [Candidatus Puniceispirillaceae bacterium]